eukprot:TRINITY_DN1643_c0_g1_i7.p1 TRINITY_DN1643_c0_g1~~TRINITY_DN1643_c0_g1_i7.p1  ORF type:complete len:657 (-),score=281.88 TRINITY_DN1643_c0_g1_i7:116-2086(-)
MTFVWDATERKRYTYVNGELHQYDKSPISGVPTSNSYGLTFGGRQTGGYPLFGAIKYIKIFSTRLSEQDIRSRSGNAFNPVAPLLAKPFTNQGLLVHYDFTREEPLKNLGSVSLTARAVGDVKFTQENGMTVAGNGNVQTSYNDGLNFEKGSFTVEVFGKLDAAGNGREQNFAERGPWVGSFLAVVRVQTSDTWAVEFCNSDNYCPARDTSKVVKAGQWLHMAYVWDATERKRYTYVNGQLHQYDKNPISGVPTSNSYGLTFGGRQTGGYPLFGSIKYVKIFNRRLSEKSIQSRSAYAFDPAAFLPKKITNTANRLDELFDTVINRLQNQNTNSRQESTQKMQQSEKRRGELQTSINTLSNDIVTAERQVKIANDKLVANEATLKSLDADIETITKARDAANDRVKAARARATTSTAGLESAIRESQELIQILTNVRNQLNEVTLVEQTAEVVQEGQDLKTVVSDAQTALARESETVTNAKVKNFLQVAQAAFVQLAQIQADEPQKDTQEISNLLLKLINELTAYVKQLNTDLAAARAQVQSTELALNLQVQALEHQLTSRMNEKAAAQIERSNVLTSINTQRNRANDLNNQFKAVQTELNTLQKELAALQPRMQTEEAERNRQIALLKQLKAKVNAQRLRNQMVAVKLETLSQVE